MKLIDGFVNFPVPGDPAELYVDTRNDCAYRWSRNSYKIMPSYSADENGIPVGLLGPNGAWAGLPYGLVDEDGNIGAQVNHRTNSVANLMNLAGGNGELSVATDVKAIVSHNGVVGGAVFYLPEHAAVDLSNIVPVPDGLGNVVYTVPLLARRMSITKTAVTDGGLWPYMKLAPGFFVGQKVTLLFPISDKLKAYPFSSLTLSGGVVGTYYEHFNSSIYGGMTIYGVTVDPPPGITYDPYEREYVWDGLHWQLSQTPDRCRSRTIVGTTSNTHLGAVLIPSPCGFVARIKLQIASGTMMQQGEYAFHGIAGDPWGAPNGNQSGTLTTISPLTIYGSNGLMPDIAGLTIGFEDVWWGTANGKGVLQIKGTPSTDQSITCTTTTELLCVPI